MAAADTEYEKLAKEVYDEILQAEGRRMPSLRRGCAELLQTAPSLLPAQRKSGRRLVQVTFVADRTSV